MCSCKPKEQFEYQTIDGLEISDYSLFLQHQESLKSLHETNNKLKVSEGTISEYDSQINNLNYNGLVDLWNSYEEDVLKGLYESNTSIDKFQKFRDSLESDTKDSINIYK